MRLHFPFLAVTKETDDPEDTAQKVGISALIVQVNDMSSFHSGGFSYFQNDLRFKKKKNCVLGFQRRAARGLQL